MCPDGVRGYPGLAIERGERIAIHAAATKRGIDQTGLAPWGPLLAGDGSFRLAQPLALGAIVATAVVHDAMPIAGPSEPATTGERLVVTGDELVMISGLWLYEGGILDGQLPLGDYRPGRWGWLLTDVERLDQPLPVRGRQGVWTLSFEDSFDLEISRPTPEPAP